MKALGTIRAFSATWRRSFIHPLELSLATQFPPWCLGCDAKHRLRQHMLRRGLERSQAVPADAVLARPGTLAQGYAHGVAALRLSLEVGV